MIVPPSPPGHAAPPQSGSPHPAVDTDDLLVTGAGRWRRPVLVGALAVLVAGGALAAAGLVPALVGRLGPAAAVMALTAAAALLAAAAGLLPAAVVLYGRAGGARTLARLVWWGGWPQAVLAAVVAEAAIAAAILACRTVVGPDGAGSVAGGEALPALVAGLAVTLGFPLLVFERHLTAAGSGFPEAAALARLLRLPLLVLAGGGLGVVVAVAGVPAALWLVRGLSALAGVIALETLLRAVGRLFLPAARGAEVRALAGGTVAALVLDRRPGGRGAAGTTLADRFGIDLSRSWALGFVRRAVLPLVFGLMVLAWGVTALTALGPDQRGIYERLGAPVAVFGPGLSLHLPWPFGMVRPTEYGTVHEIAVALPVDGSGAAAGQGMTGAGTADGPAPADADRLWVEVHPSEVSYLLPGAGSSGAFELVDLDLRLVYRIGMTDGAAIAAHTRVSEPEALIRAYAGAWLIRLFSTRTLPGLLREDTSRLQQEMKVTLQRGLDEAGSGLELLAVVIDAIHPPPGAAAAYHGVHAAGIRAAAEVARQRRDAVTVTGEAREKATMTLNLAATNAAETQARAAIDRIRFLAELQAQREAGEGVALDRRLTVLERSLAGGTLTIIDRRIPLRDDTTLDFRNLTAGGAAASDAVDSDIPVARTRSPDNPDNPASDTSAPGAGTASPEAPVSPGSPDPAEGP